MGSFAFLQSWDFVVNCF